ncbi:hypothetical protein B7R54_18205 [Subtercola boreus]|uniref:Helix-turn-helix domain-containing protein n=1 Tax=Subtercola boreus TaxID=120213 RepID=A0A3E0VLQ9_9MICO|nr:helix-turn-helix domain-containing protein [Subtercola boreus]RFA10924.1 hypothetical protein B7R54_18205 [Subtercola boreus]TQL55482.1 excisionase family DNA binding protein [Subtercola boreus]
MPLLRERATEAVEPAAAKRIGAALSSIPSPGESAPKSSASPSSRSRTARDASMSIDGVELSVPPAVRDAVRDLLQRFAEGQSVVVGSTDALLTTSQAAELIGISATYLLRLANEGTIPVEYRGTHRRFRLADAMEYLEASRAATAARPTTPSP